MRKVLKERKFKVGYVLRYEEFSGDDAGGGKSFVMVSAVTCDGHYIGDGKTAFRLIKKRGIKPELAIPEKDNTCSIGFCEKENRWYGWSHRAICGFGIGDVIDGDHCALGSEVEVIPSGFKIETLEDARRVAVAFADSVG